MSSSSSSSSSSPSTVHHASLVSPDLHSPVLLTLVDVKLSKPLVDYVAQCTADTVDYAMGRSPVRARPRPHLKKFTTFVTNVLLRAEVTTPVVLATLAYIDRAKPHLQIALEDWALERVFLGALIIASKYLNDSTLKNVHWALCTGVFGKRDVGRIEREFLDVLDWELSISEADVLSHHDDILAVIAPASRLRHRVSSRISQRIQPRNHHRHAPCPELEPSSPISSDGSISPQTPDSLNSSPESSIPSKGSATSSNVHGLMSAFSITTQFPIHV
ncbi:hypothetical protein D9757_000023 [Collybiopsis confluens]|uniref:Cyclin-like domain-containing protein n=1 Tax=Collybiopsis confluens TaxID=2823264 RepID=A0A8H5MGX1_9AGAR|nr:hypothetical protein D9757_015342 [Collybiopsis confluens]KAF5393608.1 hypothetical protein D9757_000023 [Collybiopsis confluens]